MYINIRDIMHQTGMTRYELAKLLDITYPTVTAIYNSTITNIKFETLEKICQIFKCTPNDILIFENNKAFESTLKNDDNFSKYMNFPQ